MEPVIILAGGFGTRISEFTDKIPKPMIPIGTMPILWHILKFYSNYGIKDFGIALGYKSEVIKNFFLNYSPAATLLALLDAGLECFRIRRAQIHALGEGPARAA